MMGISIWQLLIILVIVLLLFGTKRLRNLGADLGATVKGFKSSMKEGQKDEAKKIDVDEERVIEGEATVEEKKEKV